MIRELMVCGQGDAVELPGRKSWVVVSIHDPGKPPAELSADWGAVLQLAFHDKEDEQLAAATGLWRLFTARQAQECLAFVREHAHAEGLLVHCFAGASRSPAVARVLARVLNLPCDASWAQGNQLVYRRLLAAAAEEKPPAS